MYRQSTVNEVPNVYTGPFRRRRDQQKTLLIMANEVAKLDDRYINHHIDLLPQESMQTEPPDPDYMDQPHGPHWRATHD